MKAYLITTGIIFAVLTVLHIWRIAVERSTAQGPFLPLLTALTAALFVWAMALLRKSSRS